MIQKQLLLLLIKSPILVHWSIHLIQKQLLLLLIKISPVPVVVSKYSKTTFVTVNLHFIMVVLIEIFNSKTTFVTVNPSFLKALYFII